MKHPTLVWMTKMNLTQRREFISNLGTDDVFLDTVHIYLNCIGSEERGPSAHFAVQPDVGPFTHSPFLL